MGCRNLEVSEDLNNKELAYWLYTTMWMKLIPELPVKSEHSKFFESIITPYDLIDHLIQYK